MSSSATIQRFQASSCCQKCGGSSLLYHDYDPHHFHDGITCLACGTEQVLTNGRKSLIDPTNRSGRKSWTRWAAA